MIVLSSRLHDKIGFPDFDTTIEIVALQSGTVRLGIDAPEQVRVLRDSLPERNGGEAATLHQLNKLVEKRLEITRQGLDELRRYLEQGLNENAEVILERIDEDLHLLRRRVRRELEQMMQSERDGKAPSICRSR
jgi:sRNA-binding carbon storage regulator CsrA